MKKEIFVFGSNTEGRHGRGAALEALQKHGAIYGQARGLQGNSYAIITKDLSKGSRSIPLKDIERDIIRLSIDAKAYPDYIFNVTKIGCGLAGYTEEEIAALFRRHKMPNNVILPKEFQ